MEKRRVVVTGLGTVNPTGKNLEESWNNIKAGYCGIDEITAFDTTEFKVKLAGEVKDFDPSDIISKKETRHMARFTQMAVTAAAAAVAGVAYLFKDEIRGTETYKNLNEKYDVDKKIKDYSEKAKDTAYDLKDKAKVAAKDIKAKAEEWKASQEDDIFEDDEIIINDVDFSEDRDYVSIKTEEATDAVKDAVDDIKND